MDKENFVSSFANENMKLENIEKYNTLEEALNKNDMIVTGVPISKDKKYIVANYTNLKIKLDFFQQLIFAQSSVVLGQYLLQNLKPQYLANLDCEVHLIDHN